MLVKENATPGVRYYKFVRVYRLLEAKWAMTSLCERKLKVSRLTDLNDPFECLPLDFSAHPTIRHSMHATKQGWSGIFGVVCFSRSWSDPVLWAHYADAHKGICLGFDVPDFLLREVEYIQKPMTLNELMAGEFERLYLAKSARWRYEDEVRRIVHFENPGVQGLRYIPMDGTLHLREVILGCRCLVPIADITSTLSNYGDGVIVLRAALARGSFDMVEGERLV